MKPEKKEKLKRILKVTGIAVGGAVVGLVIGKATNSKGNTIEAVSQDNDNTGLINENAQKIKDEDFELLAKWMIDFLVDSCEKNNGKFVISEHNLDETSGKVDQILVAEVLDVDPETYVPVSPAE